MKTLLLLVALGVIAGCSNSPISKALPILPSAKITPAANDPADYIITSASLSSTQVASLEHDLISSPGNLDIRAKLLGHYWRSRISTSLTSSSTSDYNKHAVWVIRNAPDSPLAGSVLCEIDSILASKEYEEAGKLWDGHLLSHPENAAVAGNAANFFQLHDRAKALSALITASQIEPSNADWPLRIAEIYDLEMGGSEGAKRSGQARSALRYMDAAEKILASAMSADHLTSTAQFAIESGDLARAERDITKALTIIGKDNVNQPDSYHHAHLENGRIHLRRGNIKAAGTELLEAANVPGSPPLSSFGPNMLLAKELLQKGERTVVLKYFDACAKFWSDSRLTEWKKTVQAGSVPDFGANENY